MAFSFARFVTSSICQSSRLSVVSPCSLYCVFSRFVYRFSCASFLNCAWFLVALIGFNSLDHVVWARDFDCLNLGFGVFLSFWSVSLVELKLWFCDWVFADGLVAFAETTLSFSVVQCTEIFVWLSLEVVCLKIYWFLMVKIPSFFFVIYRFGIFSWDVFYAISQY